MFPREVQCFPPAHFAGFKVVPEPCDFSFPLFVIGLGVDITSSASNSISTTSSVYGYTEVAGVEDSVGVVAIILARKMNPNYYQKE